MIQLPRAPTVSGSMPTGSQQPEVILPTTPGTVETTCLRPCLHPSCLLQALPASMKQPEEQALLEAAQEKSWRNCPNCGWVVGTLLVPCQEQTLQSMGEAFQQGGPQQSGPALTGVWCKQPL